MTDIRSVIESEYRFIGEQHKETGVLISRVAESLRKQDIPEIVVQLYGNYDSYVEKTLVVLNELISLQNIGENVVTYRFADERFGVLLLFAYAYSDIIKLDVVQDGFTLFKVRSLSSKSSDIASYVREHLTVLGYIAETTL